MSIQAIATCSECRSRVYWKAFGGNSGWAAVEGKRFTCFTTDRGIAKPHKVVMPNLTDQGALETWLQS